MIVIDSLIISHFEIYVNISQRDIYNKYMVILHRIKELRMGAQSTQQELAQLLNVSQNTYSQYENGKRQIPIEILIKLALHYEVSTDYILNITDIDTPYPLNNSTR